MPRDQISICNEALGDVPAELISDIDDTSSQSARHCKRLYDGVVTDLLETHDWDCKTKRVALAQITNTRTGEWPYAYAMPIDVASPLRLVPTYTQSAGSYGFRGMSGIVEQTQDSIEYRIDGGVLFTWLQGANLEYVSNNVEASQFSSLLARAIATELAYRLVMPLINDAKRQGDLARQSELARQRAIADDINRNQNNDLNFESERAMARGVAFDAYGYRG